MARKVSGNTNASKKVSKPKKNKHWPWISQ
jgi:hypothetical protein